MARDEIFKRGWRRHSVISHNHGGTDALLPYLPDEIKEIASSQESIILISTYDCAVVSPCFDTEPWIQILVAFPIDHRKDLTKGRNPRRLHFVVRHNGKDSFFETNARCICQVDRRFLLNVNPDLEYSISGSDKYDLKHWLAERFRQDTWPSAFNTALKPAQKRLRSFMKRYNNYVSGIYVKLDTYDEITTGKYSASIIIAVESGKQRGLLGHIRDKTGVSAEKSIDEVLAYMESEVVTAFGDTLDIEDDPTKKIKKAVEIIDEVNLTVDQLRCFPRLSPYSLSDFNSDAPLPAEMTPAKIQSTEI